MLEVVHGHYLYYGGIDPADELWHRIIENPFRECKREISAAAFLSTSESIGRLGAPTATTSLSSIIATPPLRDIPGIPTPSQTSRRQPSSAAPSLSSSGEQLLLNTTVRNAELRQPVSNLDRGTFDENSISDGISDVPRGGLEDDISALEPQIHEASDIGAYPNTLFPSLFPCSTTVDNSLESTSYANSIQQQDQGHRIAFSEGPTNDSGKKPLLLGHMYPATGSSIDGQGHQAPHSDD